MTKTSVANMRSRVLRQAGLEQFQPATHKHKQIRRKVTPTNGIYKTPLMRYLEEKYGKPIQDVLTSGSLSVVAKFWGNEVDVTTISKWIKKLKLRYMKDNLPDCTYCNSYVPTCDLGVCQILMDMELWDLVQLKRMEILKCLKHQE